MNEMTTCAQQKIEELRAEIQKMVQTATQDVLTDVHALLSGARNN